MKIFTERNNPEAVRMLQAGGVGVLRTDTLYGVVASILHKDAVERVYSLRQRDLDKPCIILAADTTQLPDVNNEALRRFMTEQWPGPISLIMPTPNAPEYLTRGGKSLAFRIPADEDLRALLERTGPLVAPSANVQGEEPARTIEEAQAYFGDNVDFYVDNGEVLSARASQLWRHTNAGMERLR